MTRPDEIRRKRFYKEVTVAPVAATAAVAATTPVEVVDDTFRILLDGRPVRTPGRQALAVARRDLADMMAAEWASQREIIDPLSMPLTRLVNSAIDGVTGREGEVRASLLEYGGSDLLCYLAAAPPELLERQSRRWGAIHTWAKRSHNIELQLAIGIMPVAQDPSMLDRLDTALGQRTPLELAAVHVITTMTGSVLLALALVHHHLDPAEAWELAHLDDDFQIERWGADTEATQRRAQRWQDMKAACLLLGHSSA